MCIKNIQFFVIIMTILPVATHGMLITRIAPSLRPSTKNKIVRQSYSSDASKFLNDITKVGLYKCTEAYNTQEDCKNSLCCRGAFKDQAVRNSFLWHVDNGYGRLNAAELICAADEKLCRIQERIEKDEYKELKKLSDLKIHNETERSYLKMSNEYKELKKLIAHQRDCLKRQFCVIMEANPSLPARVNFSIDEKKGFMIELVTDRKDLRDE